VTRPGVVIVHVDHAQAIVDVFSRLFAARFPIDSAFNCRQVTGGTRYSEHSYGWAIDINPVQNPYVNGSTVLPPAGRDHLDRSPAPGRITANDAVVQAFAGIGWSWGGYWTSLKDYQHFSATNR
jgi:poly-gamma-glutamate synthesis protein (capsule biosynthesis protein)